MQRSLAWLAMASALLLSLSACGELEMPGLAQWSGGSPLSSQSLSSSSALGLQIAAHAERNASGGTGWCYQYVAESIHAFVPAFLSGEHAYMAADQLAAHPRFDEVQLLPAQLAELPAGAVVVWSKGSSPSGHISIADGRGYEISDHRARQMQRHYGGGSFRVFLPR
ncbi:MAG: hypothetical protein IGS03_12770 [Candidatus Sericytochromatia bacterium]|nr:hypothetical protein [Candidatus Sericytochromatia bacterium]